MKPIDLFIGIIDFFSNLVPGAIAAFFLITVPWNIILPNYLIFEFGSTEGWVVFLISAYILGHIIAAIGSLFLDDYVYDAFWVNYFRINKDADAAKYELKGKSGFLKILSKIKLVKEFKRIEKLQTKKEIIRAIEKELSRVSGESERSRLIDEKIKLEKEIKTLQKNDETQKTAEELKVESSLMIKDELLDTARELKRQQLKEITSSAKTNSDNISSTFHWALTVIHLKSTSGTTEVDSYLAQSKLFRSISLLIPILLFYISYIIWNKLQFHFFIKISLIIGLILILGIILFICLWRFLKLRWDATNHTYEYFIACSLQNIEVKSANNNSKGGIMNLLKKWYKNNKVY